VHLSQEAVDVLFGKGYQLKKLRALSQPNQFAAEETVEVIGPKGKFESVRVLGPTRGKTQIEVSRTDTFKLGVEAPVRESGNVENTPRVTLRGPDGDLETNGLIIAARHIHMSPNDAKSFGLKNGDYVDVKLGNGGRDLLFSNTLIRVSEKFVTEMHIDTDEANAAGISVSSSAELVRDDAADAAVGKLNNMELDG
jgi:acetate kinase